MNTILRYIDDVPDKLEIESLLGITIYRCYTIFCLKVISLLSPKTETWAGKSRRGAFYHSYNEFSKVDVLDIEMWMNNEKLKCVFRFSKRKFIILTKNKNLFCEEIQKSIEAWSDYNQKNNGNYYNIDIFINESTLIDSIKLIE